MLDNYFLSNRKQRALHNGQKPKWGNVNTPVPQGSILGPLLYLIVHAHPYSILMSGECLFFVHICFTCKSNLYNIKGL